MHEIAAQRARFGRGEACLAPPKLAFAQRRVRSAKIVCLLGFVWPNLFPSASWVRLAKTFGRTFLVSFGQNCRRQPSSGSFGQNADRTSNRTIRFFRAADFR